MLIKIGFSPPPLAHLMLHLQRPRPISYLVNFLIKIFPRPLVLQDQTFSTLFKASSAMASGPDQSILDSLRGTAVESAKKPSPRLVKIYISSSKQGEKSLERMN